MNKIWRRPGPQPPPVCAGCPPSTPPPLGTCRSGWAGLAPGRPAGSPARCAPWRRSPTTSTKSKIQTAAAWSRTSFLLFLLLVAAVCRAAEQCDAPRTHSRTQLDPFYLESLRSGGFKPERIRFNGVEKVQIAFREEIKQMVMVRFCVRWCEC